jgi:hypothetical protein
MPPPSAPDAALPHRAPVRADLRVITLIFRALAMTFAAVGIIFLLCPDGTVATINAAGALFRIFPPAPRSELRFWLSLAVSYMALVTVLAAMIQRNPLRYRHLMPVLAAGKFCSSFTCLLFFVFSSPTFLYLLNFLVDGSITALALGCYAWLALSEPTAQNEGITRAAGPILATLAATLIPTDGPFPLGAQRTNLVPDLWEYFRQLHVRGPLGLALLLYGIEYGPFVFGPKRRRFSGLSADDREKYLAGFERSRLTARRQLIASLKLIAMLHFYSYRDAQQAVGYDGGYVREKLLAGPNAAFHRVRLQ